MFMLPYLFVRPVSQSVGAHAWLILPAISLALAYMVRIVGRRMEKRADKAAASQEESAGTYARALEKLYQKNQMPAVNESRRKTHPHLYDRMLAAGIQPDFPRPKPPNGFSTVYALLWVLIGAVIGFTAARHGR
jgi:Zn-dependent protease with chaperone function